MASGARSEARPREGTGRVLILPGDGIGPEVTGQAVRVLEAVAQRYEIPLAFESGLIGGAAVPAAMRRRLAGRHCIALA